MINLTLIFVIILFTSLSFMEMITLQDFEEYARLHLERTTWTFYSMGAEREETLKENLRSFTRYRLIPRMLRNAPSRDLSMTVLGDKLPLPLGIAPTAFQRLAHPDGELAAAAAAAEMGIIYTLSTVSTSSLEDVARVVNGASPLWMQVYTLEKREHTEEMIRKAEACGYKALVLTIDTPVIGLQHKFQKEPLHLPSHLSVPNIGRAYDVKPKYRSDFFCKTLTWNDVSWIKRVSKLPIVLKGILSAEDAVRAASLGADAVWISNHGGRQLDCVDATIDVLPAIASALSGTNCEVYLDGGIRWGTDILKAVALGAKAVFIGRPALWGLTHSGKQGVKQVINILKSELDRAMHLAGCKDIQDIGPHLIRRKDVQSQL